MHICSPDVLVRWSHMWHIIVNMLFRTKMSRTHTGKEASRSFSNEGTSTRTRPFSYEEVILRRKKKLAAGTEEISTESRKPSQREERQEKSYTCVVFLVISRFWVIFTWSQFFTGCSCQNSYKLWNVFNLFSLFLFHWLLFLVFSCYSYCFLLPIVIKNVLIIIFISC